MSPRRLLHIPRHTIRLALLVVLGAVLLFFALTRTQVGRAALRDQMEQQFLSTFEGQLQIGQLKGNLAQVLFARDVRLLDPTGRVVIAVDSVVARPSWRSLFRRRISIGSLTLIRPTFHLRYQADSTWNLAGVFRRRTPGGPSGGEPWSFESAEVRIVDGRIVTDHEAALPPEVEQGWVFDYARTEVRDLQARCTIEWSKPAKLIDVLHFTASLPDADVMLDDLQGQMLLEEGRLLLNQVVLQAGRTDLRLDAALERGPEADTSDAVYLEGTLQPSRLDADQLRRLFPRLPVAGLFTVSGRMQGPLAQLVVEEVAVEYGPSRIQAEGTLLGLPDSLDFEVALRNTTVSSVDLRAALPTMRLPDLDHLGPVALSLTAQGVAHGGLSRLRVEADVEARGAAGRVAGSLTLRKQPGSALRYTMELDADTLNVGALTAQPGFPTALNGHVAVQGRSMTFDSLTVALQADLRPSVLAGRRADTLHIDASIARRRLEATGFVQQQDGRVFAKAELNLNTRRPVYSLGLITRRLDLGPLLAVDTLRTAINSQWTLAGAGASWEAMRGDLSVTFDSSQVTLGGTRRLIPPHRTTLALNAPGSGQPRLRLDGDAVALRLDGDAPAEPTLALATLWRYAFGEAADRQRDKPYTRDAPSASPFRPAVLDAAPLDQIRLQEDADEALRAARLDSVAFDVQVTVKRSDVLSALLPMLPPLRTNARTRLHVAAQADRLTVRGTVAADSLQMGSFRADSFHVQIRAAADLDAPVEQSLDAVLTLRAATMGLAGQTFPAATLEAAYQRRTGRVTLAAGRDERTGPLRLAARLDVMPDRNRLALDDFLLMLGDHTWTHTGDDPIDVFADAIVVPGLLFESRAADGEATQRLRLRGTRSQAPQDTFFVDLEAIQLQQWSDFLARKPSFGGVLNGRLALTSAAQPEVTGALTVDAVALEDWVLGRLVVTSRYLAGSPDVALDVDLQPIDAADAPPGARVTENRVRASGTFRLPRRDRQGAFDPGALDLNVAIDRADAFFLELIFSNQIAKAEGAFRAEDGSGKIRGTFQRPIFEVNATLSGGRFEVPEYNLAYEVSGPVQVDADGVRLRGVTLRDATGGAATASGSVLFNEYRFFSLDLAADLRGLQIMNVTTSRDLAFFGQIWASGNATLTGPVHSAALRSADATTSARSEIFIPLTESEVLLDPGFIVFADSTGRIPEAQRRIRRETILSQRPPDERSFTEGLEMDLNIFAPQGSTVHLLIDPLLGDVINAVGSGRIQLQRREGDFRTFGTLRVDDGDYLFTAGELFVRRFLIDEGTITWDGDPLNARLDIYAGYQTRASRTGLPPDIANRLQALIPLVVQLHITGREVSPEVDLNLAVDRSTREAISNTQFLETYLNQPDRAAQHATSVLLTNSFLLSAEGTENYVLTGSAFNSVSQLVSSQLNRYLSQVIPNADFSLGVQGDEAAQDLDVTAGLALRLLNDRLVIRGEGLYRAVDQVDDTSQQGLQGEFVVEVRLSPSVSVEVFYRREGDVLTESLLTSETGAGLSYQTQFTTWGRLLQRLFGTQPPAPEPTETPAPPDSVAAPVVDARDN